MTKDEAIDYNKNLKMYMKISDKNNPCKFLEENYVALDMAIKALEQEPKIGYWEDDKCSVCGKGIEDLISSSEWYRNEEPNFCPFCGAKIVESEEE